MLIVSKYKADILHASLPNTHSASKLTVQISLLLSEILDKHIPDVLISMRVAASLSQPAGTTHILSLPRRYTDRLRGVNNNTPMYLSISLN